MTALDQVLPALRKLSRRATLGLVPLSDLFGALPELSGDDIRAELLRLRHADVVRLVSHDGRHGPPTDEQLAAAIVEGERTFIYCSLVKR